MLIGVIADDFTGASDIASAIAHGMEDIEGLETAVYLGVPDTTSTEAVDAGVIALKSRSVPVDDAVSNALEALEWLKSQGAEQIVFKYCSTFDSTKEGNIGPVAEALAAKLGVSGVVACPSYPANGRTVYQGHLFVQDKLLNESGMESHPLTPMSDPDIRRWLQHQSHAPVGHVPLSTVEAGAEAVCDALNDCSRRGQTLVITDAISQKDLIIIASACNGAALVTGGAAIASALPGNFSAERRLPGSQQGLRRFNGPGVILAGSCSTATRHQIDVYVQKHPAVEIDVVAVMEARLGPEELFRALDTYRGQSPIAYSSADPALVRRLQHRYGVNEIALQLDELFRKLAVLLVKSGYERIVVAGGETSGAVVEGLAPRNLFIGREIDPGVPAMCSLTESEGYGLALKSGNFGGREFFEKALSTLADP